MRDAAQQRGAAVAVFGATLAAAQSTLLGDFAPLCENSAAIRNNYGCGFTVHAYHELAEPATQLSDVCPEFTIGACSTALLDYSSSDPTVRAQVETNKRCDPGTADTMSEVSERDYAGLEEATSCEPCSPGTADLDGDPRTACQECPGGRFSGARSILCLPCRAGTRAAARASSCVACAAGEYAPPVNDTCAPCAPGVFDHDRDPSTPCATCPLGTYSNTTDLCVACEAGKHDHDRVSTTACLACPSRSDDFPGTFTAGNETLCHECAPGTHDFDYRPATPCCPVACRQGCTHRAGMQTADAQLFYPGDCVPFLVDRSTASSARRQAIPLAVTGGGGREATVLVASVLLGFALLSG
jgi:hypothetical protein